ncbi:MAG: sulfotransferase domain-containing protein, partial [Myxococcota bacterium]
DARDVFMSLWNHYDNYTDAMMKSLNDLGGEPFPHPPEDIHECWRNWITRGWFEWETEGWPFWSNLHHTRTYWEHRHLSNLLLVHYADLLADPQGQVRRVADFLDLELSPEELARTVRLASFDAMKVSFKRDFDERFRQRFRGGTDAFLFKGTNGRWRAVLSDEDLVLYEEAKRRVLTPDCAEWLERGWLDSGE